jgi:hypothetical protein
MTITTDWLVPLTLFWFVVAIYFGGIDMEVSGGSGLMQFIGLLLSYVLFIVVWRVVYRLTGPDTVMGHVKATVASLLLLPVAVMIGFRVVGGKVHRAAGH